MVDDRTTTEEFRTEVEQQAQEFVDDVSDRFGDVETRTVVTQGNF